MSQIKPPEKKKPRKSLSLSKNRTSVNSKSPASKSPSIVALFKNAPPAKISCPLCGEMVPRFGLNKHMDDACPKANKEDDDVILVENENVSCLQLAKGNPDHPALTDVAKSPSAKPGMAEKQTSPYFNKHAPTDEVHENMQVVKSVSLGSLSSKLSRNNKTRRVKRNKIQEMNSQVDDGGCIGNSSKDVIDAKKVVLHKEKTKSAVPLNKEDTAFSDKVTFSSTSGNVSDEASVGLLNTTFVDHGKDSMHILDGGVQQIANHHEILTHGQCHEHKDMDSTGDNCQFLPMEDPSVLDEFLKPFCDKGNGENVTESTETSIVQEPASENVSHPYYLRNFHMVLQTVMQCEEDMSLFNKEEQNILTLFCQLSAGSQKLYVRLFQRKLNWIKVNKIEYSEIGSDLAPYIEELIKNSFLQSDSDLQELSEALDLLSAPELKTLAKGFHLLNPTAQKQQLVDEFLRLSRQRSIFSKNQTGIAAVLLKKCKQLSGRAVRVCRVPRAVFSRVLLLFSLTDSMEVEEAASGGQTQLSTVLMVNMGRVVYPQYTVHVNTRIFQDRDDLIRYESAMHKLVELVVTMTNGNWKEAHRLYQIASKEWDELKEESTLRYHADLPVYLRCFTAGSVYTRILSRGVEVLQRLHFYQEAVVLLQNLLSQQVYCPDSRGRWWDRLALNLHQHLKCTEKAIGFIMEGLSDPYVRTGHQLSLYQRAVRMRDSPSCKKFRHLFSDLPIIEVEDVPHVTIKGKMYPQTGMGKSVFLMEDLDEDMGENITLSTVMCSVEELALAHYRKEGFDQGIHGEGSTFCTLYGLLMWDIIFMEGIPDVFRNSYQAYPLDLYTDYFFENRKEAIVTRLQVLHESCTETLLQLITDVWNAHEGQAGALVSWERFSSLQQAQSLVSCFGGPFLSGVCRIMSKGLRHCKGGLPDLVVWNAHNKYYKLVEVKGPNDRLSHKQMVWLHELKKMGADVEVCHVVSIGSKSGRLN
ncbi:fanconi-associated nuclease 1 [Pelodytes ibericus]